MGVTSPTLNFPVDEVRKRIDFIKLNAGRIAASAKALQKELRSTALNSDLEEKQLINTADQRLGEEFVSLLTTVFPKDSIICEDRDPIETSSDFRWVIDPVDGSMNFVRGIPLYAISFGLEHRETPVGGVVIVPSSESIYSAILGEGATRNGEPIYTSRVQELSRAMFSPNLPTKRAQMLQEIMADLSAFLTYARSFRRTGSFILDACWIAEGLMDAIWEKNVKHWDICATSVILAEAGGKMTDLQGKHYWTGLPELIASNGILHEEILNLLKNVRSTVSRN